MLFLNDACGKNCGVEGKKDHFVVERQKIKINFSSQNYRTDRPFVVRRKIWKKYLSDESELFK